MSGLLDVPRLARDVLRRYAIDRVEQKLPVAWVSEDGFQRSAVARDDKATNKWLVSSDQSESFWSKAHVLDELRNARAIEVSE